MLSAALKRAERGCVLALCAALTCFYVWSARTEGPGWKFGGPQSDYFNLQVDGFLAGHLYLAADVPDELLNLTDPYDPQTRPPGVGLHDASLYRGRYYLYFGVAPVVTLLLPFRALTGTALPLPAAVAVFTTLGFLLSVWTWSRVRRLYFPESGALLHLGCVLALGTIGMGPVLARRANVWELPLSGGYCFAILAVAAVFQGLHAPRRNASVMGFAVAGVSLGLAVASRPTYLFALGLLLVPLAMLWWTWWRAPAGAVVTARPLGATLAGLGALAIVGMGVAWHNYARFGDPLEFGVRYQLSGIYESKARHFALDYGPFNLRLYFLQPAAWSRYFPFVQPAPLPPSPAGYFGSEEVFGLLRNAPILFLAFLAPWGLAQRDSGDRLRLGAWLGAVAALGGGTAFVLMFFYAAMARYQVDFAPALVLLACVGLATVERSLRSAMPRTRRAIGITLGVLLAASIFFGAMLSCRLYGDLGRLSPRAYATLARIADYPAYLCETLCGASHGPVEIEMRLGNAPPGTREMVLGTGWVGATDEVFVQRVDAGRVRIGYVHDGGTHELSRAVPVTGAATHRVRIEMGSLYPPEEHPFFDRFSATERRRLARRLRVTFDGAVLLDRYQRFHPASPGSVRIGRPALGASRAHAFSGRIAGVQRVSDVNAIAREATARPTGADSDATDFDRLKFELIFPAKPAARREPLVVTGRTGRGDFLFVEYLDDGRLRFCLEHWGKPPLFGAPIAVTRDVPHRLEVALGSFPRTPEASPAATERAEVRLDGATVWSTPARFYTAEAADVFVGQNPIGGTTTAELFSGMLRNVERVPVGGTP